MVGPVEAIVAFAGDRRQLEVPVHEVAETDLSRFITICGHRPRSAIRVPGQSGTITLCLDCWREGKYVMDNVPGRRA